MVRSDLQTFFWETRWPRAVRQTRALLLEMQQRAWAQPLRFDLLERRLDLLERRFDFFTKRPLESRRGPAMVLMLVVVYYRVGEKKKLLTYLRAAITAAERLADRQR